MPRHFVVLISYRANEPPRFLGVDEAGYFTTSRFNATVFSREEAERAGTEWFQSIPQVAPGITSHTSHRVEWALLEVEDEDTVNCPGCHKALPLTMFQLDESTLCKECLNPPKPAWSRILDEDFLS